MTIDAQPSAQNGTTTIKRIWPWVLGTLLAPVALLPGVIPGLKIGLFPSLIEPLISTVRDLSPSWLSPWLTAMADAPTAPTLTVGLYWIGFWSLLYFLTSLFSFRSGGNASAAGQPNLGSAQAEKISAEQIAQVNQHWITPLGHIRAATDAMAAANESALLNERLTPELSVIRTASARLRLAIENVLDYYEISNQRLQATPRKTDIRLQIEDVVAEWQVAAQPSAGIIQYICYQDIPSLVAVDIRLLRRLLDNLLSVLLNQPQLQDCCVTLLDADTTDDITLQSENPATDHLNHFELIVDAQALEPLTHLAQALQVQREHVLTSPADPLFTGSEISAWLIQELADQLGATLVTGVTRSGRYGFRLRFSAPILAEHQAWQPWMSGKHCAVLTQSPIHAQAWRGHLSAFGAEIILDPEQMKAPLDCLFVDRETWQKLNEQEPDWFRALPKSALVIALCARISLRGRPMSLFDWAHISLPLFVRQRVLQTLLPRILATPSTPARTSAPQPIQSVVMESESPVHNNPSFKGRTALVIDDDLIYQTHLKNLLTQLGMNTLTAADGKAGLYSAEQSDLDLILTDMHLPDILGTGIVRMMRKQNRHQHTPIIAITANVQTEVHQALLTAGSDMVLTKPIALGELINAISQFIQPAHLSPPKIVSTTHPPTDQVLNTLLCDELPIYRQTLTENQHDLQSLRHIAHKLRGAAACCQAKQLQTHAGLLEDSIVAAMDWPKVIQIKQKLIAVIDQTIDERHCQTQPTMATSRPE